MDIKSKSYSHALYTKIIVFIVVIACFSGAITLFINTVESNNRSFDIILEENYFQSRNFMNEVDSILSSLTLLISQYKNEENILNGETISKSQLDREEKILYSDFVSNSKSYNPNLTYEENYEVFKKEYEDRLIQVKDKLIAENLKNYKYHLSKLDEYSGLVYYVSDGKNVFTNSSNSSREYFEGYLAYLIFDETKSKIYPSEILDNPYYYWINLRINNLTIDTYETQTEDTGNYRLYLGFTDEFLNTNSKIWNEAKMSVTNSLYKIAALLVGLIASFIYLIVIIGRKAFNDKEVHLNTFDKLYTDINLSLCIGLIALWIAIMTEVVFYKDFLALVLPLTAIIGSIGLIFILSLIKHIKNRSLIRHSLIFTIFHKFIKFIRDVYDSGSVAVKIVLIVVGYPLLVALTFFMFPVTIGVAAWLALKKVKEFNAIKEGVEKIKNGHINHSIEVNGKGEFARLASNINSITDGLNKAVENELKSQRLKTELITNVSHDIRTPLTSIITYVDLLKNEQDNSKAKKYIEILDQKAQRLKVLTDDLFEASKASSGDIPVNYEKIDIISLITQGLGELNHKVEESQLQFRLNHPNEKVYIKADGKLLWRAIENLLSNIFKYALKGSRVYIDIDTTEDYAIITMKNISAYELNISADELMERFKRGDESRSSQGSGLGLSIAKSLVNIQRGIFDIEIDGDLFKVIIKLPKYRLNS